MTREITLSFDFSNEQSRAMSNFVNGGLYYFSGGTLYGRFIPPDGDFLRMGAIDLGATEARILDEDISPAYMLTYDGYIYYVRYSNRDEGVSIAKIKTDGTELSLLYEGEDCDFLQTVGERLYFTDENHHFVSTEMGGSDIQTVIDREIYYPYFLDDDIIIFQDEADGESLHLLSLSGEYDIKLNDMASYSPVICGSHLYYLGKVDENTELRMCRIDLADISIVNDGTGSYTLGRDAEIGKYDVYSFYTDGQTMYGANGTTAPLTEWSDFTDDGYTELCERTCHIGDGFTVYYRLNPEEKVLEVFIRNQYSDSETILPVL